MADNIVAKSFEKAFAMSHSGGEPHKSKLYSATFRIFQRYWSAYGGWRALVRSFYFHFAAVMSAIMWGHWSREGWWETPLSVLPNIIGFSVGGYALLLSFGNEKFQNLMAKAEVRKTNAFVDLCAAFTHFVLMQFLALVFAVVAKSTYIFPPHFLGEWPEWLWKTIGLFRIGFWWLGDFIFVYAMLCGVAATMRIFRLSQMFAKAAQGEDVAPKDIAKIWTPDYPPED